MVYPNTLRLVIIGFFPLYTLYNIVVWLVAVSSGLKGNADVRVLFLS